MKVVSSKIVRYFLAAFGAAVFGLFLISALAALFADAVKYTALTYGVSSSLLIIAIVLIALLISLVVVVANFCGTRPPLSE